jgi:predicted permease
MILLRLLPVLAAMGVGAVLRRSGVAGQRDGEFLFKLVFYVCLPALTFTALATVSVRGQLVIFALASPVAVAAGYLAGRVVARTGLFTGTQVPVLLTACMVINAGFMLPIVQALYGAEGVARLAAFDALNATLTVTWGYYTAARGNPAHAGQGLPLRRVLTSPPLVGVAAGLAVNHLDLRLATAALSLSLVTSLVLALGIALAMG